MKKLTFLTLMLAWVFAAQAQTPDPVKWTFEYKAINDSVGKVIITADIQPEWHLYSQYNPPSKDGLGGAMPLEFYFDPNPDFLLLDKVVEPPYIKEYNDIWEADEYFFIGKAVFTQKIKPTGPGPFSITGTVKGQACKDMCVNTRGKFDIKVP